MFSFVPGLHLLLPHPPCNPTDTCCEICLLCARAAQSARKKCKKKKVRVFFPARCAAGFSPVLSTYRSRCGSGAGMMIVQRFALPLFTRAQYGAHPWSHCGARQAAGAPVHNTGSGDLWGASPQNQRQFHYCFRGILSGGGLSPPTVWGSSGSRAVWETCFGVVGMETN